MRHDHKKLDLHVSHNIIRPRRSMNFCASEVQDSFWTRLHIGAAAKQEKRKRGQVKREKSMETLRQAQLIACTTQCSKTADENMSVWGGGGGWGGVGYGGREKDREGEKPDETSQKYSSSLPLIDTLPQPDSFIFTAIVCQCANAYYQPPPVWVSTLLS